MRTSKQELISDELKPFACQIIKEARLKYNYSFEDLSKALGKSKNRQTLHKYETGSLNIPYDIFFERLSFYLVLSYLDILLSFFYQIILFLFYS